MRIDVLTLFPKMLEPLRESILGRAQKNGSLTLNIINIRDFSPDKHLKCDDYPFGGGNGMVMTPIPIYNAIKSIDSSNGATSIYLSPKGETLNQSLVKELATQSHIILLCGHYEGVDQRVIDACIQREISIGDYVLTGGEPAAIVLIDCISRYLEGVLGNSESVYEESFSENLLEYPHYTRPQDFLGESVPDVLVSGHHENIRKWRLQQAEQITKERRPDLYEKYLKNKHKEQ